MRSLSFWISSSLLPLSTDVHYSQSHSKQLNRNSSLSGLYSFAQIEISNDHTVSVFSFIGFLSLVRGRISIKGVPSVYNIVNLELLWDLLMYCNDSVTDLFLMITFYFNFNTKIYSKCRIYGFNYLVIIRCLLEIIHGEKELNVLWRCHCYISKLVILLIHNYSFIIPVA